MSNVASRDPMIFWQLSFLMLLITLLAFILRNFPWVLKYYSLKILEVPLHKKDLVLIVSDLHLKNSVKVERIRSFMSQRNLSLLVIAGDLFDDKHVEMQEEVLVEDLEKVLKTLHLRNRDFTICYILSLSSHDPLINREKLVFNMGSTRVLVSRSMLKLVLDQIVVHITHGDYSCRNGAFAFLLNKLMGKIGQRLFLERHLKRCLALPEDSWLIMGHIHIDGIDHKARVANSGAWKGYWLREATHTGIYISDGEVRLLNLGIK